MFTKRILIAFVLVAVVFFLFVAFTFRTWPPSGRTLLVKSSAVAFVEGKALPNGWIETSHGNEKIVGDETDYWIYLDHGKTGRADTRIHCYWRWRFKWGFHPKKFGYTDREILADGQWCPVNR